VFLPVIIFLYVFSIYYKALRFRHHGCNSGSRTKKHHRKGEAAMNTKKRTDSIYELLGLQVHASAETVKKTFREFALKNHPDFFPGDRIREEKFKRVCAAYQTWKLIHTTLAHIRRMRNASMYARASHEDFRPWTFSCTA